MIQTGDGLGFALEALLADSVRRKMRGENLDGDGTFQARVACPIHLAHPARTKRRLDFVGAKSSTWLEGHSCRDYKAGKPLRGNSSGVRGCIADKPVSHP